MHALHRIACIACNECNECNDEDPSMSPDTPALSSEAASVAPVEASPQRSLPEPDLLTRVFVARDLDQQPFTSTTSLWHG
jgi:hypothetical protein